MYKSDKNNGKAQSFTYVFVNTAVIIANVEVEIMNRTRKDIKSNA